MPFVARWLLTHSSLACTAANDSIAHSLNRRFKSPNHPFPLPSACNNSEQAAAAVLGYTQASRDNDSGQEPQPFSSYKFWSSLSDNEKVAAVLLGYTDKSWDNESGLEPQPALLDKQWAELTACGKDKNRYSYNLNICIRAKT